MKSVIAAMRRVRGIAGHLRRLTVNASGVATDEAVRRSITSGLAEAVALEVVNVGVAGVAVVADVGVAVVVDVGVAVVADVGVAVVADAGVAVVADVGVAVVVDVGVAVVAGVGVAGADAVAGGSGAAMRRRTASVPTRNESGA
jgi:hypothetical protein